MVMKSLRQDARSLVVARRRPSAALPAMSGCYASGGAYIVEDVPPSAREEVVVSRRDSSGSTALDGTGEDLGVARRLLRRSARIRSMSRPAGSGAAAARLVDGGCARVPA